MKFQRIKFDLDWFLIAVPLILFLCGLSTLFSISSFGIRTSLATDQLIFFAISCLVYAAVAFFDYRQIRNSAWYLYFIGVFFLILVKFFGESVFGSQRWIDIGFFRFQPSEMMKIILIIFGCFIFSQDDNSKSIKKLILFAALSLVPVGLVMAQPDLGTSLALIVITFAIIFSSRPDKKILIGILIAVAVLIPIGYLSLKPYQKDRLTSFISPDRDPLGAGYNVKQSKITVGSGGFWGKGFGGATQSQLQFLPVSHIDFIFAGWAESTGFVGSSFLVLMFGLMIWRIFAIAVLSRDKFGYMLCCSIGALILFQAFVNIGMNIGIMPATGIPLPLVSYGGTSLIITGGMLGLCQSVFLRRKSLRFE